MPSDLDRPDVDESCGCIELAEALEDRRRGGEDAE